MHRVRKKYKTQPEIESCFEKLHGIFNFIKKKVLFRDFAHLKLNVCALNINMLILNYLNDCQIFIDNEINSLVQ